MAAVVYENDDVELSLGNADIRHTKNADIRHTKTDGVLGASIAYYIRINWKSRASPFILYMTKDDVIKKARKLSCAYNEETKTFGNGPWKEDFDTMALNLVKRMACWYTGIA